MPSLAALVGVVLKGPQPLHGQARLGITCVQPLRPCGLQGCPAGCNCTTIWGVRLCRLWTVVCGTPVSRMHRLTAQGCSSLTCFVWCHSCVVLVLQQGVLCVGLGNPSNGTACSVAAPSCKMAACRAGRQCDLRLPACRCVAFVCVCTHPTFRGSFPRGPG